MPDTDSRREITSGDVGSATSSGSPREGLDRLWPAVFDELKRLAHLRLHAERDAHTLCTTALVHEVYLRLADQRFVSWDERAEFFGHAARAMRRILVDYARRHGALRRGGGSELVPLYAAVYPAINIASRGVDWFSEWRFVASIMLDTDPAVGTKYAQWGLRRGENAIFMRLSGSSWQMARIDPFAAHQVLRGLIPFTPPKQILKTHRMPHHDAGVPGTAPWRFASMDDGLWVPCGQACCRVDDRF